MFQPHLLQKVYSPQDEPLGSPTKATLYHCISAPGVAQPGVLSSWPGKSYLFFRIKTKMLLCCLVSISATGRDFFLLWIQRAFPHLYPSSYPYFLYLVLELCKNLSQFADWARVSSAQRIYTYTLRIQIHIYICIHIYMILWSYQSI